MAYEIIPNVILFAAILAAAAMVFRRMPEIADADTAQRKVPKAAAGAPAVPEGVVGRARHYAQRGVAVISSASATAWRWTSATSKKVWHFMLEAKDLKQGQILASKFARIVSPVAHRYTHSGVHGAMSKAEHEFSEGNFDEAEQAYFEVIRKFPHEYTAYEGLVKIYIQQKQYDNLSETLEYLVKHVPENDAYWAQYGNVLMSTRHYAEAAEAYRHSVELNQLIPARFANLALSLQAVGDKEGARQNFQKASDLDPANAQYLIMLADSMVQLEERGPALQQLRRGAEFLPENKEIKEKIAELEIVE